MPNDTDNCLGIANPGQEDSNGDGLGDACDQDGDGVSDDIEDFFGSDPDDPNSTPENVTFGDSCSDGIDNDLDGLTDGADPGC